MSSSRTLIVMGVVSLTVALVAGGSWSLLSRNDSGGSPAPEPSRQHFRSRPDLRPPPVTVKRSGATSPGYVFLAPKKDVEQAGPMIIDSAGQLVWFHPLDTHGVADFKVQNYGGRPVLTWWRGRADKGVGDGYYVIMSDSYREIARVFAGDRLAGQGR